MAQTIEAASATLSIGEVARLAGLQTSAIRYYERLGLLPTPERSNGRRRYGPEIMQLLAAIETAKAAGFSLKEIERLVQGFDPAVPPSERWRELAQAKLEELRDLSARIDGMRALLRRGLECGCLSLDDCDLLSAPQRSGRLGPP